MLMFVNASVLLIDQKKTDCRKLKTVSRKFKRDQQEPHFKTIRQQISSKFEWTIYTWRYGCVPHVASRTSSPLTSITSLILRIQTILLQKHFWKYALWENVEKNRFFEAEKQKYSLKVIDQFLDGAVWSLINANPRGNSKVEVGVLLLHNG